MTRIGRVTIVVPTLNAGALLDQALDAIDQQDASWQLELLAIDSGSTDGTVDRLNRRGVRVVQIGRHEFNHGDTRNRALSLASGDAAVLLVQDAVPASRQWLRHLVEPLEQPTVAGSFARQMPWPEASRLTTHYLASSVACRLEPRVVGPLTHEMWDALHPMERCTMCVFDNVCSCLRLDVWRQHAFRRTPIAEDVWWAVDVMRAGYRLAYAPSAAVWHSHDRSFRYELHRTYLIHQQLQRLFGLSTVPTSAALARSVAASLPLHLRLAADEPRGRRARACLRGIGLAVAMPLGQYLGARSAREGREFLTVTGV